MCQYTHSVDINFGLEKIRYGNPSLSVAYVHAMYVRVSSTELKNQWNWGVAKQKALESLNKSLSLTKY